MIVVAFSVILFCSNGHAQNYGVLRGFLSDSLSGEVLPYGNIIIKELNDGIATDNRGYYLFPALPAHKLYTVVVSYVGYKEKEISTSVQKDESTLLNIQLVPISIELQTIEKVVKRIDGDKKSDISVRTFTMKELENIPQGVETDVLRSIQNVPGVTISSDVSAKYYVRGGSNDQNLVLLNDATIYHPFHALGMFSIVDPEMINSFDFYKGGFPTEFSGRVSSVMDLITKYGNKNKYSGSASLSLLTAKASFEGPLPNGSFMVTSRKSVSNKVLKNFYNNKNVPVDFYDFSFNLNYSNNNVWQDARFIIHGFVSDDKISRDNSLNADYLWNNSVFGLTYFQVHDFPLFYKMSITSSNFNGKVEPKLSNIKPKQNEVHDISYTADFTYLYSSKDILDVGVKISNIKTILKLQNSFGEFSTLSEKGATISWSFYGKYQLLRFNDFGLELGTRFILISLNKGKDNKSPFEPRLRLTYRLNPTIKIQASAGVFIQELTTLSDEDEVISIFEPWITLPDYISATRSTHFVTGVSLDITDNWEFSSEGYYKKTINLPLINQKKVFPKDPDLIIGESEAYGTEFVNRIFNKDISLTTTYSLAWVYNLVDNISYKPKYDIRHSLNLRLDVNLGKGWSFNAFWAYKSGLPFTKLIGYYNKFYFNDNPNEISLLNMYSRFSLLDERNTGQTPAYHRLDINLLKRFEFPFMKLFVGFSILNLYDRENLFYFDLNSGERVNMLPFLPSVNVRAEI